MKLFSNNGLPNRFTSKIKIIINFFMICIYLGLGIYFIIEGWPPFSKFQSTSLGTLLTIYGIFRILRLIREGRMKGDFNELSDNNVK